MASKASGKAVDRLAVVDETQANRQTIEIYELVTRKMRIGRVPLFFKALAAEKALIPCWEAMRPAIRIRAFEEAADDLRARAARTAVDLGCPLIETQLEWAGYDVDEIDQIRGQVDIFHYANAKLLMAASLLGEALHGGCGGVPRGPRGEQRIPRGVPHDMDPIELVAEDPNGPLSKVFKSIRVHLGLGLVPTDFRALGRWPKYLELAWSDARKRDEEGAGAVKELGTQANEAARQLPVRVEIRDETLRAAGADPARVRALVDRFRRALPGLVLDLALFKVQLDGGESARESPFPIRWKYISSDEYTTVALDEPVKLRAGDPKDLDETGPSPDRAH
ncbi:MAG TPA: halocarboxylic acid dehydrogenase DehI family protein [Myxococcales bacterium]|nr:halocarboxylic acid dehydrogenase DehI family protein [Myxococcales bacterium]